RHRMAVVHGDEIRLAEKEIDVVRVEAALVCLIGDAVQDDVEVSVVRLDLRKLQRRHRVLDRERVKRERVAQYQGFRDGGRRQIDPHDDTGRRIEPATIDARDLLGPAVPVDENRDHVAIRDSGFGIRDLQAFAKLRITANPESQIPTQSPTLTERAACAAASRATGTRYGDALT